MPDYGSRYSEKTYALIDRKLQSTYGTAKKELQKKLADFNRRFNEKDRKQRQKLADGRISANEYKTWLAGQVFMRSQWQKKIDEVSQVMFNHNVEAARIIRDNKLSVFAENYNYQAFLAEKTVAGVSFDVYNTQSVARLIMDDPQILPEWKIDEPKDYRWNYQKVNNIVKQGIIQGEGVPEITKRLCEDLSTMNENKMRMFARTAITGAQNAGRQQQMEDAAGMGINVHKQWLATLDSRTRDAHRDMDGEEVPYNEDFSNGLEYPGDPAGDPAQVYNCRCTMVTIYPEYEDRSKRNWREEEETDGQSYDDWKEHKIEEGSAAGTRYGEAVSHISKPYKKNVVETLKNAPLEARRLWRKYKDKLDEPQFDAPQDNEAYFSHADQRTHFLNETKAYAKSTYQQENACYFHEYGHNLDYLAYKGPGMYYSEMYKQGLFQKTLHGEIERNLRDFYLSKNPKADFWWEKNGFDYIRALSKQPGGISIGQSLADFFQVAKVNMNLTEYRNIRQQIFAAGTDEKQLKSIWSQHMVSNSDVMKYFNTERKQMVDFMKSNTYLTKSNAQSFSSLFRNSLSIYQRTDISDMYDSYFEPKFGLNAAMGTGHPVGYFGAGGVSNSKGGIEAFAEMYSATVCRNDSLETIKQHFPDSYQVFEDMLKEMGK